MRPDYSSCIDEIKKIAQARGRSILKSRTPETAEYSKSVYLHELGHKKSFESRTLPGKVYHASGTGMALAGTGTAIAEIVYLLTKDVEELNPKVVAGLTLASSAASLLSDVPTITEEVKASKSALKDLRSLGADKKTIEAEKKRLTHAGLTYAVDPAFTAAAAIPTTAGLMVLKRNPELGMGLLIAGAGVNALRRGGAGEAIANALFAKALGDRDTLVKLQEIQKIHKKLDPELPLHIQTKPGGMGVYVPPSKNRAMRWIKDIMLQAEGIKRKKDRTEILDKGGIVLTHTPDRYEMAQMMLEDQGLNRKKINKALRKMQEKDKAKEEKQQQQKAASK